MFENMETLADPALGRKATSNKLNLGDLTPLTSGYSYTNFLADLFEFMVDTFEYTNNYFLVPHKILHEDDNMDFLTFGLEYDLLWVVPINDSKFCYIEVVHKKVCEDVLSMYVHHYAQALNIQPFELQDFVRETTEELKQTYIRSTIECLTQLGYLASSRHEVGKFGVCNITDLSVTLIEGTAIPVFTVPLSQFILMVSSSELILDGVYGHKPEYFYKLNRGYYKKGISNVGVNADGTCIVINSVRRKGSQAVGGSKE